MMFERAALHDDHPIEIKVMQQALFETGKLLAYGIFSADVRDMTALAISTNAAPGADNF